MKRIVKAEVNPLHYRADACIIWCFDDRFSDLLNRFVKARRFKHYDLVKVAGGAKVLSPSGKAYERKFVLDQVLKSIKLHHTKLFILMVHTHCGDYGGILPFGNAKREAKHHAGDLRDARAFLRRKLPRGVKIEPVFADFEGISRV